MSIPKEQRALVLDEPGKFSVQTVAVPDPASVPAGAVLVKVLSSMISANAQSIYKGYGPPLPKPGFTTGLAAIARIAAVGPDATVLKTGDLIYVDDLVRIRDDPSARGVMLWGYFAFSEAGLRLANNTWRNACNAQYAQAPMENCYLLNEQRLLKELGYIVDDLGYIARIVVPFSGFVEMQIKAGEVVAIAPATGSFGGSGIWAALAMGAHVVAAGRNQEALDRIMKTHGASGRISLAKLTGTDAEADAKALREASPKGALDAYIDFVPFSAENPTLLKSGLLALRWKGRACIMGGCMTDISIPYTPVFSNNLRIYGRVMYERETPADLIRLVEAGLLPLGEKAGLKTVGTYALEDYEKAFAEAANETGGLQTQVVFKP